MKSLTTGEFAKLCGTQKGTLFFYDAEGLLKPRYVSENGYRRYGPEQFFEYEMISLLKETGSSLKEIKLHLRKRNPAKLFELFAEKKALLKKEKEKIARRQKMLDVFIGLTRTVLDADYDSLEVADMDEEILELMPVAPEIQTTAEGCATLFAEFSQKLLPQGRVCPAPFGVMMGKADAVAKRYLAGHFFCGGNRSTPKADLHIRPKGLYAVFLHAGDMGSHQAAYAKMLEDVEKSGLTIIGNVYAYDLLSSFITGDVREYAAKYCVQVE